MLIVNALKKMFLLLKEVEETIVITIGMLLFLRVMWQEGAVSIFFQLEIFSQLQFNSNSFLSFILWFPPFLKK